jgi:hypothetical protein
MMGCRLCAEGSEGALVAPSLLISRFAQGYTFYIFTCIKVQILCRGRRATLKPLYAMGYRVCTVGGLRGALPPSLNIWATPHHISARCAKVTRWPSWQDMTPVT